MAAKYYLTLTNYGSTLIAQAHEQSLIQLQNFVIGDANNVPYDPITEINRTTLVNQKASVPIQDIQIIDDFIRVTATFGTSVGGFNIHEIGITNETGQLVYIGNYHGGYKPILEDGAGGQLTILIDIKGTSANNISLIVDENINTATQAWVKENYIERSDIVDNLTTDDATKPVSAKQAKFLQDNKLDKDDVLQFMPIAYPKSTPPSGYLAMMGQAISQVTYPKLYALYGANLPDMRAYTIRGLDNGRGIDLNRVVLTEQGDAIRNIEGILDALGPKTAQMILQPSGAFKSLGTASGNAGGVAATMVKTGFDASLVVPTASENRVKNIAFLYIVKAG